MSQPAHNIAESDKARGDAPRLCPCGSGRLRLIGSKGDFPLRECSVCGTIHTLPPDLEGEREFYDHYYDHATFETHPVVALSLERLVRSAEPFRRTGRWFDVGFGEGALLEEAGRKGWECYGSEISPAALRHGERRQWRVTDNADADKRFVPQTFDIVTMIELLEHVPEPDQMLEAAARYLRPGGLLYVTTPNARSLNRRLIGLGWSIFCPPEHITIWSARGLRHALARSGFKVQRVRTDGFNPCEILARWRTRDEESQPVNRNNTALALNSFFSGSPLRRTVKAGINHSLGIFKAGDTLKIWAVRS